MADFTERGAGIGTSQAHPSIASVRDIGQGLDELHVVLGLLNRR